MVGPQNGLGNEANVLCGKEGIPYILVCKSKNLGLNFGQKFRGSTMAVGISDIFDFAHRRPKSY